MLSVDLSNQVAIVTGGDGGLGSGIVVTLAINGGIRMNQLVI